MSMQTLKAAITLSQLLVPERRAELTTLMPSAADFGSRAVLDANGQKVEMSATAIQKVIMNLSNKNHEFAVYLVSLKATKQTGFYTPTPLIYSIADIFGEKGFRIERFLLATAGKGGSLSSISISDPKHLHFRKTRLQG